MTIKSIVIILAWIIFQTSCSQKTEQKKSELKSEQIKVKKDLIPGKDDKVYQGTVNLITQKDIDEFGKNKYTFINGSMNICDINSSEFSKEEINLDALKSIRIINGGLLITRLENLKSVRGLENLEKVNGDFVISGCGLNTISTFEKLATISGDLVFGNNDFNEVKLTEITGFSNLTEVGSIFISGNSGLQKLDAFHKIEKTKTIQIINTSLERVDNFKNLKNVKNFSVEYSSPLKEINLEKLENVSGLFALNENTHYNGQIRMPNIRKINHLFIIDNNGLENYCDFSSAIKQNQIDTLSASGNKINMTKEEILTKCK
ncbi:hypothetical protein [Chryseobacterium herbae]|uniref:Receptor L-domain domain-containing protein n=1 Tax=Chryseobacterium herbae TaxID=2976476 RepID=A0ABT2IP84_9FLAO|nr:hypothetical protein [Chryseobacterium sp. pc1-10]MCT2560495.1 hypothetical protein [Chryseobacterium sp. pc1-10]